MKKVPIVLLILGGVLANFIGMVGCICMSILLFDIWSISCVLSLVIGGHVTGAVFLQRLYQRRWQIGKAIFWLCAGLPSALIGIFLCISLSFSAFICLYSSISVCWFAFSRESRCLSISRNFCKPTH